MKKILFLLIAVITFSHPAYAEEDELDPSGWSIRASTEKTPVALAFDGDVSTCFESSTDPKEWPPHSIYIDAQQAIAAGGIRYTPPQDMDLTGVVGTYNIYASEDGETYYQVGQYSYDASFETRTYYFPKSVEARYFKLSTSSVISGVFRAAEIRLLKPAEEMSSLKMAEKNLEEGKYHEINNAGMTATADSAAESAGNVLDGSSSSIWHSRFQPVRDELPLNITVDLAQPEYISGVTYLPRQDSFTQGRFQVCEISVSLDGKHFQDVAKTDWADSSARKYIYFNEVEARYVKMKVLEGTSGYAVAAEIRALETGIRNREKRAQAYRKYILKPDSAEYSYQQGAQISSKRAEYTPILHKGTCMIPIQTLSEVMNCDVNYNEQNLSVQISKGEDVLRFQLDDDRYYFNDVRFNTAVKPVLLGGMVYVPFRAWAERFGYQVAWNPKTSEVAIGNDLDYKWYND